MTLVKLERRLFPMLDGPPIPWTLALEIFKIYEDLWPGKQGLEGIAARGGFAYEEIKPFMVTWHKRRERGVLV